MPVFQRYQNVSKSYNKLELSSTHDICAGTGLRWYLLKPRCQRTFLTVKKSEGAQVNKPPSPLSRLKDIMASHFCKSFIREEGNIQYPQILYVQTLPCRQFSFPFTHSQNRYGNLNIKLQLHPLAMHWVPPYEFKLIHLQATKSPPLSQKETQMIHLLWQWANVNTRDEISNEAGKILL